MCSNPPREIIYMALCFVVGNKNDCPEKKVVQTEDAQKFADQIGIQLYETSAKENLNVEEVSFGVCRSGDPLACNYYWCL